MTKSEELKSLQAPLKKKYREDPESAIITIKAKGKIGEGVTCSIETGRALAKAGLHLAAGGDGTLVCSGDLLLEALVACAGVTLSAVATSIGIDIKEGIVKAEGDLDFKGTLAVSKDVPVGFKAIRLFFELDCDADDEKIKSLQKLTERYCVVYQTLIAAVPVQSKIEMIN